MTMTAQPPSATPALHMGVQALDQNIKDLRRVITMMEHLTDSRAEEARLQREIEILQESLAMVRRQRAEAAAGLEAKREELKAKIDLRALCVAHPGVAQLIWLELIAQRTQKI